MHLAGRKHQYYKPMFKAFKYTVYLLLTINIVLFLREEMAAAQHVFSGGVSLVDTITAFAATIDTAAWVVLLLLFELETYVLDDEDIEGGVKWSLHGLRVLCYSFIVYAFYGYTSKAFMLLGFESLSPQLADCTRYIGWSLMTDLDEFVAMGGETCAALAGNSFLVLPQAELFTTRETYQATMLLAWTDVFNAGAWLLVCLVLEIDVRNQLSETPSPLWERSHRPIKVVLYSILFIAAAYWGISGDVLDFWDALLWLLAFIFIELNIFEWHISQVKEHAPSAEKVGADVMTAGFEAKNSSQAK